ncbi:hypothetical protein ALI144C_08445 [Actinosynnema sp. ALI-1.44]|nr:hypothetical protein ALI144C_08445 [Actinosynnema sp. ALI-1.44]
MAVFGAVAGVAMLIFGIVQLANKPTGGFLWLWVAFGVGIIGFNLWAAFSKRGATYVSDDDSR